MKKNYITPKTEVTIDITNIDILQGSNPKAKIGISSSTYADEEEELLSKERSSFFYDGFDF